MYVLVHNYKSYVHIFCIRRVLLIDIFFIICCCFLCFAWLYILFPIQWWPWHTWLFSASPICAWCIVSFSPYFCLKYCCNDQFAYCWVFNKDEGIHLKTSVVLLNWSILVIPKFKIILHFSRVFFMTNSRC